MWILTLYIYAHHREKQRQYQACFALSSLARNPDRVVALETTCIVVRSTAFCAP
jgi:hypothetical protein